MTNRDRLEELFRTGKIAVERGALFDGHLPPKPAAFDFDRVEGIMLGVAVGDGLGIPTEGRLPGERIAAHGRIRDYLPNNDLLEVFSEEAEPFPESFFPHPLQDLPMILHALIERRELRLAKSG